MDTYTKTISITSIILIAFIVIFTITGCGSMIKSVGNIIGINRNTSEDISDISSSPKKQMWQTIKALTPNWLAIPVIALGAVAMFNGMMKLGMSCVIFGSVNLFMALATSRFGFWMAICGLIGSCAAVAASMLTKNKALKELVFGIQKIKTEVAVSERDVPAVKEILAKQVNSTKKIVAKIKSKNIV